MNAIKGIGLLIGSTFVFTIMAAMIRIVSERIPTGEIVFARSFFALFPLLGLLAFRNEISAAVRTDNPLGHILRGIIGVGAMGLSFTALAYLPLADATAIGFTAPLITVALASVMLGETVRFYRWAAVGIGLLGVVIMLSPHMGGGFGSGGGTFGAICGLIGAFCTAGAMVQVRRLTATETTAAIVFYFQSLAAVAGLATAAWGWVVPNAHDAMLLLAIGLFGGVGQILMTESYRFAPASVVAPFNYAAMIWSLALGFVLFGEVPPAMVIVGALVVIGAGLFVIWREHQLGLHRDDSGAAGPQGGPTP